MPRKWQSFWPVDGEEAEASRDGLIHTLGNLTLLTGKLNSKVSNGPWPGISGKRGALEAHDVLILNRDLLKRAGDQWTDDAIRTRTDELITLITQIWRVPENHRSGFSSDKTRTRKKVNLADLITGGALNSGMALFPRHKKFSHRVATLLADGQVEVDGVPYPGPSEAASTIVGQRTNGWGFFLIDQLSSQSLRNVRRDYVDAMAVDADDDEQDDDSDED